MKTEIEIATGRLLAILSTGDELAVKRSRACALYAARVIASEVMELGGRTEEAAALRAIPDDATDEQVLEVVITQSNRAMETHFFAAMAGQCAASAIRYYDKPESTVGNAFAVVNYGAYTLTKSSTTEHAQRVEYTLRHFSALIDVCLEIQA